MKHINQYKNVKNKIVTIKPHLVEGFKTETGRIRRVSGLGHSVPWYIPIFTL